MSYTLRDYQANAVEAVFSHLTTKDTNALVVMPTGCGKSVVLAEICRRAIATYADTTIIVATSVKELLVQNHEKLVALWPEGSVGFYSAGLRRKDKNKRVTFAGIQSVWRHGYKFPRIDILVIDEVDLLTKKDEGTWRKFIGDLKVANPFIRIIGLTASPFRLNQGLIYEGEGRFFDEVCYEYGLLEAIDAGWLCPPKSHRTITHYDTSKVGKRGNEFIQKELQASVNIDALNRACVKEIVEQGKDRMAGLLFCSGVQHAFAIRDLIREYGETCETVHGGTPSAERSDILVKFADGRVKYVSNDSVLSVGYDNARIDLIADMHPTKSARRYLQQLGRGFRLYKGKLNCLILNFSGNAEEHGCLDKLRPKGKMSSGKGDAPLKSCPSCMAVVAASARICPECGDEFLIDDTPKIKPHASGTAILSNQLDIRTLTVRSVHYARHRKEGRPDTFKATYIVNEEIKTFPEWTSPESDKRSRFEAWWRKRSKQLPPADVTGCLELKETLTPPKTITVRVNGKYFDILNVAF